MAAMTSRNLAYDDFGDSNVGAATTPAVSPVVAAPLLLLPLLLPLRGQTPQLCRTTVFRMYRPTN